MTMTMARECGLGYKASSLLIMLFLLFFLDGCTFLLIGTVIWGGACVCAQFSDHTHIF